MNTDLTGRLLIALPSIGDPLFSRSVILLCAHSPDFAMGIVLNKPMTGIRLPELFEQLDVTTELGAPDTCVLDGGPVSTERGFVIHTDDVISEGATLEIDGVFCMTTTRDMLEIIGSSAAPRKSVLALGYSGWGAGQLEVELAANAWLVGNPDDELVFGDDYSQKWTHALSRMGVDSGRLQIDGGSA